MKRKLSKDDKIYFIKQKVFALVFVLFCIVCPFIDVELCVTLLFSPLGIFAFFTKEKVIMFKGFDD